MHPPIVWDLSGVRGGTYEAKLCARLQCFLQCVHGVGARLIGLWELDSGDTELGIFAVECSTLVGPVVYDLVATSGHLCSLVCQNCLLDDLLARNGIALAAAYRERLLRDRSQFRRRAPNPHFPSNGKTLQGVGPRRSNAPVPVIIEFFG